MKITAARSKLREKIEEEISARVQAALEDPAVSYTYFLSETCEKRKFIYRAFRKKMSNARVWKRVLAILAGDRFEQLLKREIRRQCGAAADSDQFVLPGFENIPRRLHIETLTVREYIARQERYEKRAGRINAASEDRRKLAEKIRGQPGDLLVPEALERAERSQQKANAKRK